MMAMDLLIISIDSIFFVTTGICLVHFGGSSQVPPLPRRVTAAKRTNTTASPERVPAFVLPHALPLLFAQTALRVRANIRGSGGANMMAMDLLISLIDSPCFVTWGICLVPM